MQRLTEAEMDVLLQLADGMSVHESAQERGVTDNTIKSERKHLMQKLGSRNGAHAVALAYHRGVLQPQ
jgi:DNA-binding CsgD family transcriptional regulator